MMQLGGNIRLEGFDGLEPGKLVVVKKIVGSYARQVTDSNKGFEGISLSLAERDGFCLSAAVRIAGSEARADAKHKNLFFALNDVLAQVGKNMK